MTTSDERREVAERLREEADAWRETFGKYPDITGEIDCGDIDAIMQDAMHFCGIDGKTRADAIFDRLADLIDPTCVYEPTETLTRWDENDHEHETNEPDFYCETFACSRCGYEMIYGGEYGWFDTEPPYAPHFKFCPNCSARVLPLKLYDKVVSGDGD